MQGIVGAMLGMGLFFRFCNPERITKAGWDHAVAPKVNSPDDKFQFIIFCFDKKLFLKARAMTVYLLSFSLLFQFYPFFTFLKIYIIHISWWNHILLIRKNQNNQSIFTPIFPFQSFFLITRNTFYHSFFFLGEAQLRTWNRREEDK